MIRRLLALAVSLSLLGLPVSLLRASPADHSAAFQPFRSLPLSFEANRGQSNPRVAFIARGGGQTVFLTPREAVLTWRGRRSPTAVALRMQFIGASARSNVVGAKELPGKVNYFLGRDSARWRTNIPTYEQVRYQDIYPGIDLVFYGNERQLEYDFLVQPGADLTAIAIAFVGAENVQVDAQDGLLLQIAGETIYARKPAIYQEVDGRRQEIAGGYVLRGVREVGFQVAAHDPNRPVVIDPVLYYSTYLGGTNDDEVRSLAVDANGNAYVTGETSSTDFPTSSGVLDTALAGLKDAYVTKLNPTGSALVYSTYLGGAGNELGRAIKVDAAGNAYVAGETTSADFAITPGAVQGTLGGMTDGFIIKLNPSGSALIYSTYLGGASDDRGEAIAIDAAGNAYVTGRTASKAFPTVGAIQTSLNGRSDAFVAKLDPTGSSLAFSTYLGGGGDDKGSGIAVDAAGNVFVAGETASANFPTTPGAFRTTPPGGTLDAYFTKLNPTGSALVYSSYLGGTGSDRVLAVALDTLDNPNLYLTGRTTSTDFPTTPGAFRTTPPGGAHDGFVAKVNSTGSALAFSTYLGGTGDDQGEGIAVDGSGSVYVTGETGSADFPTTVGAIRVTLAGITDAYVVKLNPTGASLVYSTYLGGTADEEGFSIAVDAAGSAYVAGLTTSVDFPTTAGAVRTTLSGLQDGFVAKIADSGPPAALSLAPTTATIQVNTQHCITATVRDAAANPVRSVTVRFSVTGAHSTSGALNTDANGQATFCYATTQAGNDSIAAFADTNNDGAQNSGEPGGTATATWVSGPPATLTLAPKDAAAPVNTQRCITATVKDGYGNPVTGAAVLFTVSGSVAATGSVATDTSGQAPFCYMGPSQAGSDSIAAFADTNHSGAQDVGEPGDTATTTWAVPGAPATFTLVPSAASTPVNTQHCVTATVKDAFGSAVAGVTVQFAVSGSVATAGSGVTDANGQAQFCYIGPSQPGTDTIAAFADANNSGAQDTGEPGDTATTAWAVPGTPAALTLAPSTATNPLATQHCVTATVTDTFGSTVAGVTVQFVVSGSVALAGSAATDASGQAPFCYMGPSQAGSDTIAAFADTNGNGLQDSGEPGGTATKTWVVQ